MYVSAVVSLCRFYIGHRGFEWQWRSVEWRAQWHRPENMLQALPDLLLILLFDSPPFKIFTGMNNNFRIVFGALTGEPGKSPLDSY